MDQSIANNIKLYKKLKILLQLAFRATVRESKIRTRELWVNFRWRQAVIGGSTTTETRDFTQIITMASLIT